MLVSNNIEQLKGHCIMSRLAICGALLLVVAGPVGCVGSHYTKVLVEMDQSPEKRLGARVETSRTIQQETFKRFENILHQLEELKKSDKQQRRFAFDRVQDAYALSQQSLWNLKRSTLSISDLADVYYNEQNNQHPQSRKTSDPADYKSVKHGASTRAGYHKLITSINHLHETMRGRLSNLAVTITTIEKNLDAQSEATFHRHVERSLAVLKLDQQRRDSEEVDRQCSVFIESLGTDAEVQ